MPLYPTNGCRIYIGGSPMDDKNTDFTAADFSSVTWTEIDQWTDMGTIGDSAQLITASYINQQRDKKAKGTRNAGSMQNVWAINPADPGQQALAVAQATRFNYPFKIEFNDKPAVGAAPKNGLKYFIALVMGVPEGAGGANNSRTLSATLEINSNFVPVAASAT